MGQLDLAAGRQTLIQVTARKSPSRTMTRICTARHSTLWATTKRTGQASLIVSESLAYVI